MNGPHKPNPLLLLTVLATCWLIAFVYSFVEAGIAARTATDLSATAGVFGTFLGWQGVAGLFALACFGVSRAWAKGSGVRRLGALPLGLAVLLLLGFLASVVFVSFSA